ncbi:MAG: class I SAM-dependent methyltransferase [Planctomycetes bacterium]|nr:class I SAM-dependent methyltransferase [Planctomycetota bacterium]MBM4079464.1 class I SAM-dependent methyltransferase [Planctomycetota bacterium]
MSEAGVFSEYARYYDLLYKDKDYAGEADYVHGLIQRFRPGARTVLELGSGTGKHAALLAERGYEVHGIERSAEMLASAEELVAERKRLNPEQPAPAFSLGDIRTVRIGRRFDAVISLFHVVSYQITNEDILAALRTAREHLHADGVFVFDAWYGPAVLTERPAVRVKRMSDAHIEVTRLAEPRLLFNDDVVEVNYHVFIRNTRTGEVRETRETHLMRYVFEPEVRLLAAATGFRVDHAEEWLHGRQPALDAWGVCFVLHAM